MKRVALITGASKGLGLELVIAVARAVPELDELWLVSRRMTVTPELSAACGAGKNLRAFSLDLCQPASFDALREALEREDVRVRFLANNAGCGYLGNVAEMDAAKIARMNNLNVRAMSLMARLALPHMDAGSRVLNVSSIASFCPNARMTVYSACKAYVAAFSRGLGEELRGTGITVTSVCPGPMDTAFLTEGGIRGRSRMFRILPYCEPKRVAAGAVRAALRGRGVYTPRAFFKLYRVLAKLLPHALLARLVKT